MATYTGIGRTNTFAVKDVAALKEAVGSLCTVVPENNTQGPGRVTLLDNGGESGDWSLYDWDADDEAGPIFVPDVIAEHLQDGQVAVFVHVGNERLRYLGGFSVAVHSDGRQVRVNLDGIYDLISTEFGVPAESIDKI